MEIEVEIGKWYLNYGKFVFTSRLLSPIIEQFDDFWVGVSLGSRSLGFYSRAYEFAQYPRRSVSDPIVNVLFATFAKVQDDRLRLSKAYFRVASLVIRVGFLLAGTLVLVANEFVSLFLGVKWVPMVLTFQIMVIYTLLYPLLSVSGYLAAACGHPEFNTRVRVAQTICFIPAVIFASRLWGINGVAAATDTMLLIGLALSLHQVQKLVDVSLWRMLAVPTSALLVAGLASWQLSTLASDSTLIQLSFKASIYVVGYSLVSLLFEQEEYFVQLRTLFGLLLRKQSDDA